MWVEVLFMLEDERQGGGPRLPVFLFTGFPICNNRKDQSELYFNFWKYLHYIKLSSSLSEWSLYYSIFSLWELMTWDKESVSGLVITSRGWHYNTFFHSLEECHKSIWLSSEFDWGITTTSLVPVVWLGSCLHHAPSTLPSPLPPLPSVIL